MALLNVFPIDVQKKIICEHCQTCSFCVVYYQQFSSNRDFVLSKRAKYKNRAGQSLTPVIYWLQEAHFQKQLIQTYPSFVLMPFPQTARLEGPPHRAPLCWTNQHAHTRTRTHTHTRTSQQKRRRQKRTWTEEAWSGHIKTVAVSLAHTGSVDVRVCVRHLAFHSGASKQDVALKRQAVASECASQWDGEVCAIVHACVLVF